MIVVATQFKSEKSLWKNEMHSVILIVCRLIFKKRRVNKSIIEKG